MVQLCSGGCAIASIENRTGILHCKGDGVDQEIRQFVGISGLQCKQECDIDEAIFNALSEN